MPEASLQALQAAPAICFGGSPKAVNLNPATFSILVACISLGLG